MALFVVDATFVLPKTYTGRAPTEECVALRL